MVDCMLDARCVIVRVAAAVIEARLSDVNLCGWQNRVKQIFCFLSVCWHRRCKHLPVRMSSFGISDVLCDNTPAALL